MRSNSHGAACLLGALVAAALAAAPAAAAAVPRTGSWDSGGRSEPTVSFEVRGPGARRTVRRVSVPITCRGEREPRGWAPTAWIARVGASGRFTVYSTLGFEARGRFTTPGRAEVTVINDDGGCRDSRHYVVRHTVPRVAVRTGRFLALVEGAAVAQLEVSAFGRMVRIGYLDGSVTADCSDGAQRPLDLSSLDYDWLGAPIRPGGRFDLPGAGGSGIDIHGSFDHGSVAGFLDVSDELPDGTSCQASGVTLVGSLAFPDTPYGGFMT
jgi:hypothetical protein